MERDGEDHNLSYIKTECFIRNVTVSQGVNRGSASSRSASQAAVIPGCVFGIRYYLNVAPAFVPVYSICVFCSSSNTAQHVNTLICCVPPPHPFTFAYNYPAESRLPANISGVSSMHSGTKNNQNL